MKSQRQSRRAVWRSIRRKGPTCVVLAVLMAGSEGCKKKQPPPAPTPNAQDVTGAIASIGAGKTKAGRFGGSEWVAQQDESAKNVTAEPGGSYAHVTYKPTVKMINTATFDASLEGVGSTGHGAVFKNAPAAILALKEGDVLLVKGRFAAKILAAETNGDETVIVTDSAKIADLVQSGDINLDTKIEFHGPLVSEVVPPARLPAFHDAGLSAGQEPVAASASGSGSGFHFADLFETPVYAQNGTGTPAGPNALTPGYNTPKPGMTTGSASDNVKGALSDLLSGWSVDKWSVTPSNGNAAITARMTKDVGGFVAAISVDGTVSNFQFAQHLHLPNMTDQVMNGVKGMSGTMHFVWEIGKQTPGVYATEDKIKLPAGITIPLAEMLDGLPLTLDISTAMLIHPALTGGSEYEKGGFTISFDGDPSGENLKFQIDSDQSISAVAPAAMVISFCVPRVELRLGIISSDATQKTASITGKIDAAIGFLVGKLPASLQATINNSPLGKMSITNALASNADLFVQVIHTEGATHSPNISLVPCSKVQLVVTGQWGGDATLFNLIPGASGTKDLYTKRFTRWNPGSDFCKSV